MEELSQPEKVLKLLGMSDSLGGFFFSQQQNGLKKHFRPPWLLDPALVMTKQGFYHPGVHCP